MRALVKAQVHEKELEGHAKALCAGSGRTFHKDGTFPENGAVLVFGSNRAGRHGKGCALVARQKFGASYGQGRGRQGQSYAIPTKDGRRGTPDLKDPLATLALEDIRCEIDTFITYAQDHKDEQFFVVRLGCDLAGYPNADIAPLFSGAPDNCSFPEDWKPWLDGLPGSQLACVVAGNRDMSAVQPSRRDDDGPGL